MTDTVIASVLLGYVIVMTILIDLGAVSVSIVIASIAGGICGSALVNMLHRWK